MLLVLNQLELEALQNALQIVLCMIHLGHDSDPEYRSALSTLASKIENADEIQIVGDKNFKKPDKAKTETKFIPVGDWKKYHPWPAEGGLRHLIFHEKTNGFDKVIVRAGRRVLINEKEFFKWMEDQKTK
jgi:hypothetical protein